MSPEKAGGFVPEEEKPKKLASKKGRLAGALAGLGLALSAHAEGANPTYPEADDSMEAIVQVNPKNSRKAEIDSEYESALADLQMSKVFLPRFVEYANSHYTKKEANELLKNLISRLEAEKDVKKKVAMAEGALEKLKAETEATNLKKESEDQAQPKKPASQPPKSKKTK